MKSRKFYKYCSCSKFPFLNSFILHRYSVCTSKILTYLEYHVELAKLLIGCAISRLASNFRILRLRKFLDCVENTHSKTGRTVWNCSQCSKRLYHTGIRETDCFWSTTSSTDSFRTDILHVCITTNTIVIISYSTDITKLCYLIFTLNLGSRWPSLELQHDRSGRSEGKFSVMVTR